MPSQNDLTLAKVIAKFRSIAENEFDGKLYENALTIFNELSVKERAMLLRGLINICYIVDEQVLADRHPETDVKVTEKEKESAIKCEIDDMAIDHEHMVRLKYWLIRFGVSVFTVFALCAMAAVMVTGPGNFKIFEYFDTGLKIFKLIIG